MEPIPSLALFSALATLAAQGATLWTPADLGRNLSAWLDAQDTSTLTDDGGELISSWQDKSANGNHVTAPTDGARPTPGTGINGNQALAFHGEQNIMEKVNPANTPTGNSSYSMLAVFRIDNTLPGSDDDYVASFGTNDTGGLAGIDMSPDVRFVHWGADQFVPGNPQER